MLNLLLRLSSFNSYAYSKHATFLLPVAFYFKDDQIRKNAISFICP